MLINMAEILRGVFNSNLWYKYNVLKSLLINLLFNLSLVKNDLAVIY